MAIEIEANQVDDFFEDVKEDIKDKLRTKIPDKATETLQEQEKEIFEEQEDSDGQEWKNISMFGLLSREDNVKNSYSSINDILGHAERVDSLRDTGRLYRSVTEGGSQGLSSFTLRNNLIKYEFGTQAKGAHENQYGGQGSGMDQKMVDRAKGRLTGEATRLIGALERFQGESGKVPEREFLYWTPEAVKEMSEFTIEQLEKSVKETMSDYA